MTSSEKEKAIFRNLFVKSVDGQITPEEVQQFNALLSAYPDLEDYYIQCVRLQVGLREIRIFNDFYMGNEPDYKNQALWKEFAEYEKIAPNVEIPIAAKESEEDEKPDEIKKVSPKVSKFSIFSLLLSSAALIFLIVYALFVPSNRGIEVATLSDSLNAKWADSDRVMRDGMRLVTKSDSLWLQEGIAKLVFDNGSVVVLEGPSNFEILTEDQIQLDYGRLYASVPKKAMGFTISTANAKIIDLGTEFGVKADPDGMEVHMLRGKTLLISGSGKDPRNQYELSQGQAKAVLKTGAVQDISLKAKSFVRRIDSRAGMIWKGQDHLDLADIAGGGNGLGTGTLDIGIDPITGRPSKVITNTNNEVVPNEYHPVPSNPFIDGIFIPNGRTKQIISSQGHIFQECPITSGNWYISLVNTMRKISDTQGTQNGAASDALYAPCLVQHANMGITYDLQAMRSLLPDVNIVRFQSKFGVGKETDRPCSADFWILVDGKLRYKKTQVKEKTLFSVELELSEKDRFLTLVTTEGQDSEGRVFDDFGVTTIDSDWCRFADPVLVLE